VNPEPIALVLAGGGSRGAYEVGALSVLLPELERRGQRPSIVIGTSVGALNAGYVAANAHRPASEVIAQGIDIWSTVESGDVLEPLISPGSLGRLAGYLGETLGIPGARAWSLLDSSPLRETLCERIDFEQIGRNVAAGALRAGAVVATSARTGRSVVFHTGGTVPREHDDRRGIDYAATALEVDHVLASSAIPALFAAVEVPRPAAYAGWYVDGGTRLNTPIKPALELGAERVVVVALNSLARGDLGPQRPDALVATGRVLQGLLEDQLVHDARTLATVNELVAAAGGEVPDPGGGRTKRIVEHIVVAPSQPDAVGALARRVFLEHYSDLLDTVRNPDVALLGRAVAGGTDDAHGELLSYLFFAPEFTRELIELGAQDARRWLDTPHENGPWAV
jgi:NTE family protein